MRHFAAYLFDLDGVIYRGSMLLAGALETVNTLASRAEVAFLTNNAGRHREEFAERLRGMGLPATRDNVFSSGLVAARTLPRLGVRTVFLVGMPGLARELREAGLELRDGPPVDAVLVARDTEFTFEKLTIAQQAVFAGARLFATNRDPVYPVEDGLMPGSGPIVAAVETATMRSAKTFGKPEPEMIRIALESLGVPREEALMVGDRLDTDILCAKRAGVSSALVLTGVTSAEEAQAAPDEMRPDWVISRLPEVLPSS
ncbi:MAG: hypothetical protein AMXMBFR61_02560 [Fimbriimonadales bacterium]